MLWSLIASLAAGQGHLSDINALRCDPLLNVIEVPDSRRLGEYLARFNPDNISALTQVTNELSRQIAPEVIRHERESKGYIPVFIDGSAIEVEGQLFEDAGVGYNGEQQYWLHTALVGGLWVSGYLHPGGVDVAGWTPQFSPV